MNLNIAPQWEETKNRFIAWWQGELTQKPLIRLLARKMDASGPPAKPSSAEDFHLSSRYRTDLIRWQIASHDYLADSFPHATVNMGAGSFALYLGSEPTFDYNTVWFGETVEDWASAPPFEFNPGNNWWKRHLEVIKAMKEGAGDDYYVDIPDIIENLDILASLRGTQNLCLDLMDCPEEIAKRLKELDALYFEYYDRFYDLVKGQEGESTYTAFEIWSPGRTVKLQSDFSAMMSPAQFEEMVVPSLTHQCQKTDYSVYHLDGPDAIRHLDALMSIKELNALQWTAGAGNPDGGWDGWYDIYRKARKAGKSLHISIYDGGTDKVFDAADALVKNFGREGLYFLFPVMDQTTAADFLAKAEGRW